MSPKANAKLSQEIELSENKPTKIPIEKEDIGGELLSILSKGLYTNPLDSIREYIQNAVDAQAHGVKVKITGNSIWIHDDGDGMNLGGLLEARKFGISRKSIFEHAGFRGIGIYSGFDLCNKLRVTTKKRGEDAEYVLEFDFGAMKRLLDKERENPTEKRTSLEDLLFEHSGFYKHPQRKAAKFTLVHLEEISDVHISRFADRDGLKKYILQSIPVDFDPKFKHRKKIDKALRDNVRGYNAVTVILQSDDREDEVIVKPAIPNLHPPRIGFITNSKGEQVGYFWACLNRDRNEIGKKDTKFADYQGFVYKFKGFTIGNRKKLSEAFQKGRSALYYWYTGEIYVLDHRILPNAECDDFEESAAKQALNTAVYLRLKNLETLADDQREIGLAEEKFNEAQEALNEIKQKVAANAFEGYDTYAKIDKLVPELQNRKKKISQLRKRKQRDTEQTSEDEDLIERALAAEKLADRLAKHCESLKRIVRKDIDEPEKRERRRKATPTPSQEGKATRTQTSEEFKTLDSVLRVAGWKLDENCAQLVSILQLVLEESLGSQSPEYRRIMDELEERINESISGS